MNWRLVNVIAFFSFRVATEYLMVRFSYTVGKKGQHCTSYGLTPSPHFSENMLIKIFQKSNVGLGSCQVSFLSHKPSSKFITKRS